MKVHRLVFFASTCVATVAACSSSDSGPTNQDAGGAGSGVGSGASSGTGSGSSSGVQGTGSGSSSGVQGTGSGSSSGAAPGSGSSSGDDGGAGGSMTTPCGTTPCAMPSVCCRALSSDSGAALTCVVACDPATQAQLCANDNDCQAGPQFCVQGICADTPASGGNDGGGAPEGGGSDGGTNDAGRGDAGRPKDAGRG